MKYIYIYNVCSVCSVLCSVCSVLCSVCSVCIVLCSVCSVLCSVYIGTLFVPGKLKFMMVIIIN